MPTVNALIYDAVQRDFRNAVVAYLRERLTTRFGEDAQTRVAKAFPTWTEIKAAAARSAATALVAQHHPDEFSYLDVSHFTAIFNNEFDCLISSDGLPAEVASEVKRQLLGYLREIKTVRDPVAHPADADVDPFDALRAVDNAVRVLRMLHLDSAAATVSETRTQIANIAAQTAPTFAGVTDMAQTGLPPRDAIVVDFIGRRDELARLWEWVVDPQGRRWLLTGEGGKGKSAIAYQFASDVLRTPSVDFAAVHWLSAKRRRFVDGEVVHVGDPDFWSVETAVDRLLKEFGWSDQVDQPLETKKLLLCQLVKEFATLIVVDDVDSLDQENEDAVEYLASELPAAGAKVLLTSRRSILGMGKCSSTIVGLNAEDADAFVESRLELFRIDRTRLNAKQRKRLIKLCDGSPLYMEDLLRLCTFLPMGQAVESWAAHAGENVRRYALERELEMLSPAAREVLEACAVVGDPVSALEVQHILGKPEDSVLEALSELRRHHLVPAPELVEDIPRFAVNANLKSLLVAMLEGSERRRGLDAAVAAVTGGDLIGKSSRAIEDYRRQAEVLLRSRHFEKAEETLNRGLEVHPNNPQLLAALGHVYGRWKPQRAVDARGAWRRAYELGSHDRRMYLAWSKLEDQHGEWQHMADVAELGLARCAPDDPALLQQAGYAHSRVAQSLANTFNTARAVQVFEKSDSYLFRAIRESRTRGVDRHFIARAYRGLIINAQFEQRPSEICRRLGLWLEWDPDDPTALEEAERQRTTCPDVVNILHKAVTKGDAR